MSQSRGGDRRVASLVDALRPHLPESGVLRVPATARGAHLAVRRAALPARSPMVVVARTDEEAHRLADDLAAWLGTGHVLTLPERAALPLERAHPEHDESGERLAVLAELGAGRPGLVLVAPLLALVQRTLAPAQLATATSRASR
jgi:transcription-repair coupling factor (superfamily II helicase)